MRGVSSCSLARWRWALGLVYTGLLREKRRGSLRGPPACSERERETETRGATDSFASRRTTALDYRCRNKNIHRQCSLSLFTELPWKFASVAARGAGGRYTDRGGPHTTTPILGDFSSAAMMAKVAVGQMTSTSCKLHNFDVSGNNSDSVVSDSKKA